MIWLDSSEYFSCNNNVWNRVKAAPFIKRQNNQYRYIERQWKRKKKSIIKKYVENCVFGGEKERWRKEEVFCVVYVSDFFFFLILDFFSIHCLGLLERCDSMNKKITMTITTVLFIYANARSPSLFFWYIYFSIFCCLSTMKPKVGTWQLP